MAQRDAIIFAPGHLLDNCVILELRAQLVRITIGMATLSLSFVGRPFRLCQRTTATQNPLSRHNRFRGADLGRKDLFLLPLFVIFFVSAAELTSAFARQGARLRQLSAVAATSGLFPAVDSFPLSAGDPDPPRSTSSSSMQVTFTDRAASLPPLPSSSQTRPASPPKVHRTATHGASTAITDPGNTTSSNPGSPRLPTNPPPSPLPMQRPSRSASPPSTHNSPPARPPKPPPPRHPSPPPPLPPKPLPPSPRPPKPPNPSPLRRPPPLSQLPPPVAPPRATESQNTHTAPERASPSPQTSFGSKTGSQEVNDSTDFDDADGEGEEPAWPPLQPSPPRPSNAPSPPPPASPDIIGHFEFIGNAMMIAVHLLAIPGTDRFFFMERPSGRHPDGSRTIAGFLDLPTRRWTHVFSPDGLFCAGHTFLSSGDLLVVGGHQANAGYPDGMRSIRTFNRSCADLSLRKIRDMGWRRWYPTATLLPDRRVIIMGGTQGVGAGTANNHFWELYDHSTQRLTAYAMRTAYLDSAQQVYYPFNYLLPTGDLFTFCSRTGWILNWHTNTWLTSVPRLRGYASTQYPFTGTSVMLGLYPERDYEVEIMLFGGQAERAVRNLSTVASRGAHRLRVSFDLVAGNYTFEGWTEEAMSIGRLMGDSVLLPNGKVVVLNGAREGLAGDSASGGDSRANYPVLFADLYDPDAQRGSRFRRLALSRIPRMYHSTACLTTNGTILVAGCDRCHRFYVDPAWPYDPSPTGKADYRLEIFHPPYVFHDDAKPRIELVQGEVMQYGKPYDIAYSWPAAAATNAMITRAVLVAPCSCTHSYDMNQRLVGLRVLESGATAPRGPADGGLLTVLGPPNPNIAAPGMYMLFLLNGDVYSSAVWVRLEA